MQNNEEFVFEKQTKELNNLYEHFEDNTKSIIECFEEMLGGNEECSHSKNS